MEVEQRKLHPGLYLPPAPGVLPPKVLQVDHGQPLDHGLSGVERLRTHNEGRDSRAPICRINVKQSSSIRNVQEAADAMED